MKIHQSLILNCQQLSPSSTKKMEKKHTLPETNSSPVKNGYLFKTILLSLWVKRSIFQEVIELAVSFMEGNSRFLHFLPRLRHLSGQLFGKTHRHHLLQQLLLHGGWNRRSQHGNIWKGPPVGVVEPRKPR